LTKCLGYKPTTVQFAIDPPATAADFPELVQFIQRLCLLKTDRYSKQNARADKPPTASHLTGSSAC
jgi:hypothetical protein